MIAIQGDKNILSQLKEKLKLIPLNKIARESNFIKRASKKITPLNFFLGFFIMILSGNNSLSCFARNIGFLINDTLSKQAIDYRINYSLLQFLEIILANLIKSTNNLSKKTDKIIESLPFKRILINDSTSITLNSKLSKYFPGAKNQTKHKQSQLKLQVFYDFLSQRFCYFGITPFTDNDQSYAPEILSLLRSGDLIIRDLGYFVLSVFNKIKQQGACFLSRLKNGLQIYNLAGSCTLDLMGLLKQYGCLDLDVVLGKKEQLTTRLVAIPLSPSEAAKRRRKAKLNRDHRYNLSKTHLFLLGFEIFITNVDRQLLPLEKITTMYLLRWQIEIIFKSWKSNFNITNVPNASVIRVKAYIYITLIFITLFQTYIFTLWYPKYQSDNYQPLSLLKITSFVKQHLWAIILYLNQPYKINKQILYHCTYENRKNKLNFNQKLLSLF